MRILVLACAIAAIFTAAASAVEPAVSQSTLKSMGLSPMREMTATEGLAVRGMGAGVWGGSTATWGGQTSSNYYSAGSSWLGKPSSAGGSSLSYAGAIQFSKFTW